MWIADLFGQILAVLIFSFVAEFADQDFQYLSGWPKIRHTTLIGQTQLINIDGARLRMVRGSKKESFQ